MLLDTGSLPIELLDFARNIGNFGFSFKMHTCIFARAYHYRCFTSCGNLCINTSLPWIEASLKYSPRSGGHAEILARGFYSRLLLYWLLYYAQSVAVLLYMLQHTGSILVTVCPLHASWMHVPLSRAFGEAVTQNHHGTKPCNVLRRGLYTPSKIQYSVCICMSPKPRGFPGNFETLQKTHAHALVCKNSPPARSTT